jgi:hypothetical protein
VGNLVFISGGFSSGSTLLWTLFHKTGEYYCLYEPLHQRLPEYLIWPLRVYQHHFFVEDYFSEYKGFREILRLFKPQWATSGLYLPPSAEADDLYRYLSYLIGMAFGRSAKVVLKFNRATFRLGWLRAKFPQAKVIHIYRDRDSQWNSMVRRAQAYRNREDVGQEDIAFDGMNMATWCEDLKDVFPELRSENFKTGYERFCKLWELSFAENQRHADITVSYWELTHDFEAVCGQIWDCVGCETDLLSLKRYVVMPENQKPLSIHEKGFREKSERAIDKFGFKLAQLWLELQGLR